MAGWLSGSVPASGRDVAGSIPGRSNFFSQLQARCVGQREFRVKIC